MGGVTDEPVEPVEEGPLGRARMRPHGRHERLDEAQDRRGQADGRVVRGRAPGLQLHEDDHEGGHRHRPRQEHEEPMPL